MEKHCQITTLKVRYGKPEWITPACIERSMKARDQAFRDKIRDKFQRGVVQHDKNIERWWQQLVKSLTQKQSTTPNQQ